MMKKSLLAFATIALTTGAWGDEVTYDGVVYTINQTTTTPSMPSSKDTVPNVSSVSITSATAGYITAIGTINVTNSATVSVDVTPTRLNGSATPSFTSWQNTEVKTIDGGIKTNSALVGSTDYNKYVTQAQQEFGSDKIVTYSQMEATLNGYDDTVNKGISIDNEGNYVYFYWNGQQVTPTINRRTGVLTASALNNLQAKANYDVCDYYKVVGEPYVEDGETYVDYYYYAITSIEGTFNTVTNTTTTTTYTPTTIPSGLNWDGVTTVTIGSTITSIDNEAFRKNAGSIEKFIIKNNSKFGFDENILFTISPNNEVIFFSSLLNGTPAITLNGAVEVVRPYATKYITQSMIVYYSSDDFIVPDAEKQGENVSFVNANDPIVMEDNGKGDGGMKVKNGTLITGSQLDEAITNYINSATYLDFTGAVFGNLTKSITNNYNNKLILIGKGTNISGVNIVYIDENDDRVCDNFQLDDNYKTGAFFNPVSFTAKSAQYNRTFTEKWASIILPFGSNTIPSGFNCGTIQKYEQANNEITFTSVSSVTANVPYLIYSNTESTLPVFNNVNVVPTTESKYSSQVNGATLTALYEPAYVKSGSEETYIFSEGRIFYVPSTLTNGAKINCFRGYITTPAGTYNPEGGAATIRFINESETAIETITTTNNKDNDAIYNINGQRVSGMNANGIYVKNGKKIIVK